MPGRDDRGPGGGGRPEPARPRVRVPAGRPRGRDRRSANAQEPNVYGGRAMAMPFLHSRPRYFAQIIGELLYWLGEDRLLFGSDYAGWQPQWLIKEFAGFPIPDDMRASTAN
ncbi:amidohydrolase family protein [Actinoplanes sp. NPDC048796]|uniref:amidohydrolase family protein n=1 Tax=Actinoplanes sp. NPDC048796 TaxID=3155640 RepID=UPI0033DE4607